MSREIPLSRGMVAIVDSDDYDTLVAAGSWHASPSDRTFYARRTIYLDRGKFTSVAMHHVIFGRKYVDHVNGNGLDNRKENLRPATSAENAANRGLRSDSANPYKGIERISSLANPWRARISVLGETRSLGAFATPEEAARAYDAAAIEAWGEYARLNFPKENAV